ncbi:hypothetical protein [Paraburkholderia caledonica]|uniref:Transcriptional regulator n=1 Tax=Paraburkholderia caledonica TaxID=134536 RepID=A0AB73ILH8_9BURK|nr:hypothetical protein [Paraburkholderia caledonica]
MMPTFTARATTMSHTRSPFNDLSMSTGGAISYSIVSPDVISIAAGYHPAWGGAAEIRIVEDQLSVAFYTAYANRVRPQAVPVAVSARAVALRDRLMAVKAGLGLSTKELAEVLACARQSVYNWLDPEYQGQPNDYAMQRLAVLERLTGTWNGYHVGALGAHLHGTSLVAEGGRTLYVLLKESPIDAARCEAALLAIADQSQAQIDNAQRVDDLATRGFGR